MSENNQNSNELNNVIEEFVENADVITVPIDDTLSNSGEAADAKAVGDALAGKADRSELQTQVKVNNQGADAQGLIILLAGHIPVNEAQGAQSVAQVLNTLGLKTGADIKVDATPNAETIAQALSTATARTADAIKMSSAQDAPTVAQIIAAIQEALGADATAIEALNNKTGATIKLTAATDSETIAQAIAGIRGAQVLRVNGIGPDNTGNVTIVTVPYAENLASEDTKEEDGSFIRRTTAGSASISDGNAWLNRMLGNSVHNGFVAESLQLNVIPVTRPTPAGITATLDKTVFEAYVQSAGTYTLTYNGSAWSATPATYGVTVSGTPLEGDSITITWDGEEDPEMTVSCPRTPAAAITATIDRDVFVAYVDESGTTNLYFTTEWSEDPELYGITVTGTPLAGDQLQVVYVKEVRGTIIQAMPTALKSTGWNLYEATNGYARVIKYSNAYGYKIGGTYTSLTFKESLEDTGTAITPDSDNLFQVPGDGYVVVTGGDTDTYILMTWSDWTEGPDGSYEAYKESSVSLAAIMTANFPNGLMKVGDVRDEIDRNNGQAISRVQRLAYSAENRADAEASGRAYDFDEDYVYIERETPVVNSITLTGEYEVSDHGVEFIEGTTVPVYTEILYGENLRDKLRRDVVTIRSQTFTSDQKAQARTNIAAAAADHGHYATEIPRSSADSQTVEAALAAHAQELAKGPYVENGTVLYNNNAGFHNSIYRGKSLGTSYTAAQSAAVTAGTFDDMYVGDYWTINGVIWRIAGFDIYYRAGDSGSGLGHHIVVVPDAALESSKWNDSNNTVSGGPSGGAGYVGSKIRAAIKATNGSQDKVIAAFGSSHVLSWRALYPTTYDSSGNATGWAWTDARVELMNEPQVYGHQVWTGNGAGNGYEDGICKQILPLFALNPQMVNIRASWWLRSVASASRACDVDYTGYASYYGASNSYGVRPLSLIA